MEKFMDAVEVVLHQLENTLSSVESRIDSHAETRISEKARSQRLQDALKVLLSASEHQRGDNSRQPLPLDGVSGSGSSRRDHIGSSDGFSITASAAPAGQDNDAVLLDQRVSKCCFLHIYGCNTPPTFLVTSILQFAWALKRTWVTTDTDHVATATAARRTAEQL
jgi:hypothetical protein